MAEAWDQAELSPCLDFFGDSADWWSSSATSGIICNFGALSDNFRFRADFRKTSSDSDSADEVSEIIRTDLTDFFADFEGEFDDSSSSDCERRRVLRRKGDSRIFLVFGVDSRIFLPLGGDSRIFLILGGVTLLSFSWSEIKKNKIITGLPRLKSHLFLNALSIHVSVGVDHSPYIEWSFNK